MKKEGNFIIYLILALIILFVICSLQSVIFNKLKESFKNIKNSDTFEARTKYADVTFTTSNDNQTLHITVHYKNLSDVSALHIHTNNNGSPGPIIAWLGTTNTWQNGVTQNKSGKNSPCCNATNPFCKLAAPMGTPLIQDLSNRVRTFTVTNSFGKDCPWIKNGTMLVIHGYNFQTVVDGQLTNKKPGIDPIAHVKFSRK